MIPQLLHRLDKRKDPAAPVAFALWNLGFRPFYLLASLFGTFSVLLWAALTRARLDG